MFPHKRHVLFRDDCKITRFARQTQEGTGNILPVHGWQIAWVLKADLSSLLGKVLRKHRKAAKLSQETLSERADVDVRMIRRIETEGQNLSVNLADSLAHGLKVSLAELIREAEQLRQNRKRPNKRNVSAAK